MTSYSPEILDIEAARFVARMDDDAWNERDEEELQAWIALSSRHAGALLRAEAAWMSLDRDEADCLALPQNVEPDLQSSRRRFLIGGGLALAASLAGAIFLSNSAAYHTSIGEIRRVPLADGSIVAMNTATEIGVTLKNEQRHVRLEKGEAWFQVAKDKSRPFVVEAGHARVRAVGTAFSVRIGADGTQILVTEGEVEIWAEGSSGPRVRLKAGSSGFVASNASIKEQMVASSSMDRVLAWRHGKIDLAGDRLDHAVAEFNRYNERKIILRDAMIGSERFDGLFRTDDPEGFAKTVGVSLAVPVEVKGNKEIYIGKSSY
jgi:transmembrane sensor